MKGDSVENKRFLSGRHRFHTLFCLAEASMDAPGAVGGGTNKYAGIFTSERKFRDVLRKFRVQSKLRMNSSSYLDLEIVLVTACVFDAAFTVLSANR